VLSVSSVAIAFFVFATNVTAEDRSAEQRAIEFLAAEVPRWKQENNCYSCHNNGDAARALIAARASDLLKDDKPLADTLAFLRAPDRWDANGPEGPFKDKKLARIQFAAALLTARGMGVIEDRQALADAAQLVAEMQDADGSWQVDAASVAGSPATYGPAVATWLSIDALEAADPKRYAEPVAKARRWFESREPKNIPQAAATLLALIDQTSPAAKQQRERALELIRAGQSQDGGWGPFANAPSEPYDTALVLLALDEQRDRAALQPLITRGRSYLVASQEPDGGWPATTRPRGADSYAQRISTTGWAAFALLNSSEPPRHEGTKAPSNARRSISHRGHRAHGGRTKAGTKLAKVVLRPFFASCPWCLGV